MSRPEEQAAYLSFAAGPTQAEMLAYVPDLAERTAAQMTELARAPTPERCDRMLAQLDGARQLVARLRGSLVREGTGDGQCAR